MASLPIPPSSATPIYAGAPPAKGLPKKAVRDLVDFAKLRRRTGDMMAGEMRSPTIPPFQKKLSAGVIQLSAKAPIFTTKDDSKEAPPSTSQSTLFAAPPALAIEMPPTPIPVPTALIAITETSELANLNSQLHLLRSQWLELMNIIQEEPTTYAAWIMYRNSLPEKLALALMEHEAITRPFQRGRLFLSLMKKLNRGTVIHLFALHISLQQSIAIVSKKYAHLDAAALQVLGLVPRKSLQANFHYYSENHRHLKRLQSKEDFQVEIAGSKCKLKLVCEELQRKTTIYQRQKDTITTVFDWECSKSIILTAHFLGIKLTTKAEALKDTTLRDRLKEIMEGTLDLQERFSGYLLAAQEVPGEEGEIAARDIASTYYKTHKALLHQLQGSIPMPPLPFAI